MTTEKLLTPKDLAEGRRLLEEFRVAMQNDPALRTKSNMRRYERGKKLIEDNELLMQLDAALAFIRQSEMERGLVPTIPDGDVLAYARTLGWKDP